jgi:dsDNA-binding SOS-regulon protein
MCIDYTSLNKHCPKDHFPLLRIDQIVDSTAGCDHLSFLDAYSGYNQIKLKKEDQELTAFITPHDFFCYNVMTFRLKNAGATYQRCMQACLGEQIGRNIEVYIDDIVVKMKHATTLINDLWETFDNLDKYKIKLNPKKCFFGVPGGQVLGYFISARGIEANPLKIKAILDMEAPKNLHQVQQLAGRLAALSRFIDKLGEKDLPFYNLMKKSEKFEWTDEAQESFDNLKRILSTSPVLVTPREKETLLMYIAATVQVFSSVLVVEREEAGRVHGVQRPV